MTIDLKAQIQRLNDLLKPLKEAVQIYESIDIDAEHDRAINQLRLIRPLVQAISYEIRDCVKHGYTVNFLHNGTVHAIAFYGGIEDVDMLIYSHIPDPKILSKGIRLGSVDEFVLLAQMALVNHEAAIANIP